MIVLTTDPQIAADDSSSGTIRRCEPGVCRFAPELCANTPPSIAQQPASQYAAPGGTANFTVVASGSSPLSYQWQKNAVKLNNGGHYSGCTTATLTVSGVDSSDVASYRCVVTNAYGSVTSSVATLILGGPCSAPALLNGSFEGTTNTLGVGTNWVGYQRAPNPTTVWSIQTRFTADRGRGRSISRSPTPAGPGAAACGRTSPGASLGATYQISGWMRGNSVLCDLHGEGESERLDELVHGH